MAIVKVPPSKTRVDKAGAVLKDWWGRPDREITRDVREAVETIWGYRARFQYPLTKVNVGLRHYVRKADCEVFIAQRLKRLPRIVEKLHRHPRMRFSQMQDVGGCRAVLPDQDAVERVRVGIARRWEIITVDDYVSNPKPDGYRAVHIIVRRDDVPIEVQLRTGGQQDWADEVERMDGRVSYALKDGEGPPEVLRYLVLLAEVIAAADAGQAPNIADLRELADLQRIMPL